MARISSLLTSSIPSWGYSRIPTEPVEVRENAAGSLYHPLRPDRKEIRLMLLQPARHFESDIVCTLTTCSLVFGHLPYVALSYAWGRPGRQSFATVNGVIKTVTNNLASALRHLRDPYLVQVLWVDAICINQDDVEERSHQVLAMREIYRSADATWVWLGPESIKNDHAFDILIYLGTNPDFSPHSLPPNITKGLRELVTFKELFQRAWWSRVWVLQEVILAKTVLVQCGSRQLEMDVLMAAYEVLKNSRNNSLLKVLENNEQVYALGDFVGTMQSGLNLIRDLSKFYHNPDRFGLIRLLAQCRENHSTDPRDKIYGLLGLAPQWVSEVIGPDYDRSSQEVYVETSLRLMEMMDSTVLFSQAGLSGSNNRQVGNIPSWAPDWTQQGRRWVDIDLRLQQERLFDASGKKLFIARVHEEGVAIFGRRVDTVIAVTDKMPSSCRHTDAPACFAQWETFSRTGSSSRVYDHGVGGDYTQEYWQTILNGAVPSNTKNDGCTLRKIAPGDDAEFAEWRRQANWMSTFIDEDSTQSLQNLDAWDSYVSSTTRNRRLFICATGHLGIGPAETKRGDVLQVIAGGTQPCLLRPTQPDLSLYNLVGECYVQGIMNGEASVASHSFSDNDSGQFWTSFSNRHRRPPRRIDRQQPRERVWRGGWRKYYQKKESWIRKLTLMRSRAALRTTLMLRYQEEQTSRRRSERSDDEDDEMNNDVQEHAEWNFIVLY